MSVTSTQTAGARQPGFKLARCESLRVHLVAFTVLPLVESPLAYHQLVVRGGYPTRMYPGRQYSPATGSALEGCTVEYHCGVPSVAAAFTHLMLPAPPRGQLPYASFT
jgi:hypothetical protein